MYAMHLNNSTLFVAATLLLCNAIIMAATEIIIMSFIQLLAVVRTFIHQYYGSVYEKNCPFCVDSYDKEMDLVKTRDKA